MSDLPPLHPSLLARPGFRPAGVTLPASDVLRFPEKVVQFGTGAFLRAFVDDFIDRANRAGTFAGRVVMVGSTESGRGDALGAQGGLYTLHTQGLEGGRPAESFTVVGSVSRALPATSRWAEVLACARDPYIELVVSNTTEVGIAHDPADTPGPAAPRSFPGKLTAFLYERARAFDYHPDRGLVVLPCELIERNGATLREIVLRLAEAWRFEPAFAEWIEQAVPFCDTLVDRIAPGVPQGVERAAIEARLGYRDDLLTSAETYRLWAVQAPAAARRRLPFAASDGRFVLTDDIEPYRQRKVRILNGGHTASVPVAFLAGCETVLEMMEHPRLGPFVCDAILAEIVPSLDAEGAEPFAREVIDRFRNPYLRHRLTDILLQSTSKWRLRLVPSIRRYHEKVGRVPRRLCLGFAAYLHLLRGADAREAKVTIERGGRMHSIRDDQAPALYALWRKSPDPQAMARDVAGRVDLWGVDLDQFDGFSTTVGAFLATLEAGRIDAALDRV
jgi:tagaturonate reductase